VVRLFDVIGETRPTMMVTRQLARMASGWKQADVQQAGELVAPRLQEKVQPFARELIEEHREAGRRLVLATTTPHDMIKPFAAALGISEIVATRYGVTDGHYDGRIDGEFVWGRGKLRAVKTWARAAGVDLTDSWAYSDSYFDMPLLRAVGNPFAVQPDPRLRVWSVLMRWPAIYLDVPPGVPKLAGIEPQQLVMPFARGELFPYVRFDVEGLEHIPQSGPAIIAANHRSYFDPLAVGFTLAKSGRPTRFLGKKEVFDAPVVGDMARAFGGIRVERGSGSDEPLNKAGEALRAGELVAIMPQGTIPRGKAFFEPELQGRWGTAKLAAMSDAAVIPVGLWGTEKVWPRSARLPNFGNVIDPPTVRIRIGEPVKLSGDDLDADTTAIMSSITDLLPPEASVARTPTAKELALTLPHGYDGDIDHESERRPGTD
jgi:putative phosphoserine phosphatase/1-acylglycerol-3-phosphate O-acyltransferase